MACLGLASDHDDGKEKKTLRHHRTAEISRHWICSSSRRRPWFVWPGYRSPRHLRKFPALVAVDRARALARRPAPNHENSPTGTGRRRSHQAARPQQTSDIDDDDNDDGDDAIPSARFVSTLSSGRFAGWRQPPPIRRRRLGLAAHFSPARPTTESNRALAGWRSPGVGCLLVVG
jgi:hypothetical protein